MSRLALALTLALISTPALADDCFEIGVPVVHHRASPVKPRPPSLVRVYRFRISPPMTHRADVLHACPTDEPKAAYMTVIVGPAAPPPEDVSPLYVPPPMPPEFSDSYWTEEPAPSARPETPRGFTYGGGSYQPVITIPSPTAIPEPGTWLLMLIGFGGLGAMLRLDRRTRAR